MLSYVWVFVTPWTVAHQAPLSMRFSWQEYRSGVPYPPPGNFPDPGIKPTSLTSPALEGGFFATSATAEIGKPRLYVRRDLCILLLPPFSSSSLCLPQRCIIYILHLISRMFNFINVVEFLDIKSVWIILNLPFILWIPYFSLTVQYRMYVYIHTCTYRHIYIYISGIYFLLTSLIFVYVCVCVFSH